MPGRARGAPEHEASGPGHGAALQPSEAGPEQRVELSDWARAAGLLEGLPPGSTPEPGLLLELIGSRLSFRRLGSLVRARIAGLALQARSGAELGALIRALDKMPAWICNDEDFEAPAEPLPPGPDSYSAGLAALLWPAPEGDSLARARERSKALLDAIEAEAAALESLSNDRPACG
ncbi:hypothetical protein IT575_01230 [bacterium]|nr:hypothetical protein [bacterium]